DPNGQLSMSVKDYKGKLVHTSLIGTGPFSTTHAIIPNDSVPRSYFQQDLISNNPQQVIGNQKILDHNFFMDVKGVDTIQYIYKFTPYQVPFCTTKYLSIE